VSNALAIAGVTAVLQSLLTGVFSHLSSVLGGVKVSAVAPDIVQTALGTGANPQLQLNVFLHEVRLNPAWRNQGLPSLAPDGIRQLTNPPLALDLHYLLTAYGGADTEAEALLGYAILLLHLNPVLGRSQITNALLSVPAVTNPLSSVLSSSGLAEQIEMIKIVPDSLGREEVAWVWTAIKADYRPSFAFQVSVVLIQPQLPTSPALPVLRRHVAAVAEPSSQFGTQFAQLLAIQLPPGQIAPAQGDPVTVTGMGLSTATGVALSNARLGIQYASFPPLTIGATSISFNVPIDSAGLPAGLYSVSVIYKDTSGALQTTNSLPMGVAPQIAASPVATATTDAAGVLVKLTCTPAVQAFQSVSLALGSTAVPAQAFTAPATALTFQFPALPPQKYLARLQVDGVDSPLIIDMTVTPPVFKDPFIDVP
jgi:hypothetical protein